MARKRCSRKGKRCRKGKRRFTKRKGKVSPANRKFHKALCVLKSMKNDDRCKAMASANNSFIRKFSSTVRQLKKRKVSSKQRQKLRPYIANLRKIANPRTSVASKRKVLSHQRGGFYQLLIPLVVSAISKAVTG